MNIFAMSHSKKEVKDKILSVSDVLAEHLVKVSLMPDSSNVSHWKDEIYSFLNRVPKLKGSNKYPSYNSLIRCISSDNDILDNIIWQVCSDYSLDNDICNVASAFTVVAEYQDWLAKHLSNTGAVTRKMVHLFLDKEIKKFL